ncbi:MAG: HEAT repeat domain-containing protein [Planctomycetaceae bacterium]
MALVDIGPSAQSAVPALIMALDDTKGAVTVAAAGALGRIGKAAVPELVKKLKEPQFQQLVATVLAEIGPDAAEAAPGLLELAKSGGPETRREAILALAQIGPAAKQTAPELIKLLNDESFPFRGAVAFALGKMEAKEAIPALKQVVDAPKDSMLRLSSIWALLQFDPNNPEYAAIAVPRLAAALTDERPRVRKEVATTLGRLGAQAAKAVPDLQKALNDEIPEVRVEVIAALADIGRGCCGSRS